MFANIIDKMVIPRFLQPNTSNTGRNDIKVTPSNQLPLSVTTASSITHSNNQNSVWLSLKDTLHLVRKMK